MKSLTFRKNSWHYFLAVKVGNYNVHRRDFCSYVRNAIFGALVSLFLLTVASFVLYALGMELRAAYTCTFTDVCTFGKFEQAVVIVECVLLAILAFIFACIQINNWRDRVQEEIDSGARPAPKPGFVKVGYRALKEKTCFRVEFE